MPDPTDTPQTFGQRVRRLRERRGMTRPVLGGLVGRSAEWVKAIECGRLGVPRLPVLLRLADVLAAQDLADLTGEERLTASSYSKAAHDALPAVAAALTRYQLGTPDEEPGSASVLLDRVADAWRLWHAAGAHRTRVAALLPDLLADVQHAARAATGTERRQLLAAQTEVYHLAQLFLSFQPVPELVMLTGDRAMTAAQDADSPRAIASAAWYMNHVFRDAGEQHEARVDLAMRAADLLDPERDADSRARWGLLHLAAALSYAKVGRRGDAERYWDHADDAARSLRDYVHPYLMFGQAMVDAYAITMRADLVQGRDAVEAAERVDVSAVPSATRRAFHSVETARAYSLQREPVAVVHMLQRAWTESPETVRYNLFARGAVAEVTANGPATVRRDAEVLRHRMGVPVTA
ncbi:helix-turn-helix transcriptional regulator [Streptomyces sp. TRM 70351]|uniref:helix-turn-helix domain-containing protein n=1 Tax=Streptomyces sp. TRM 70351 TaxID=3116552 RepID=UPI002E7BDD75|nr:helix-turn-helix transcriptional regulator [Streptomyces sp. TRM 70351]MEE1927400.1 helix-turn-helix transcriptional regulator [Streptomyces sp. TRM 70351]